MDSWIQFPVDDIVRFEEESSLRFFGRSQHPEILETIRETKDS